MVCKQCFEVQSNTYSLRDSSGYHTSQLSRHTVVCSAAQENGACVNRVNILTARVHNIYKG